MRPFSLSLASNAANTTLMVACFLSLNACTEQAKLNEAHAHSKDRLQTKTTGVSTVANTQRLVERHVSLYIDVKKREIELQQRLGDTSPVDNTAKATNVSLVVEETAEGISLENNDLDLQAADHLNINIVEYQQIKNTLDKVKRNAMIRNISINNETLARQEAALAKMSVSRLNESNPDAKAQYDKIIQEFTQRIEDAKQQFERTSTERSIQEHNVALLKKYRHKLKSLEPDADTWNFLF